MVAEASTPRRRVRTGCLTCRGRRRKCDEARPVCENCKVKNLSCRYGLNITFVASKLHGLVQAKSSASASEIEAAPARIPAISTTSSALSTHSPGLVNIDPTQPTGPPSNGISVNESCVSDPLPQPDCTQGLIHMSGVGFDDDGTQRHMQREISTHTQHTTPTGSNNAQFIDSVTRPLSTSVGTPLSVNTFQSRDLYELDLLHHYRYKIAPILDLGVRRGYYSIQVMLDATKSPCVYGAVLAIASCHRVSIMKSHKDLDQGTNDFRIQEILCMDEATKPMEVLMRVTTTVVQTMITEPTHRWLEKLRTCVFHIPNDIVSLQTRLLLTRVVLGAMIMSPRRKLSASLYQFLDEPLPVSGEDSVDHLQYELHTTLSLLAQSLRFLAEAINGDNRILDSWQSCWESLEAWYIDRPQDVQEIHQTTGDADSVEGYEMFPFILFSSPCAIMANTAHHLTAILLLQNKPRLTKFPVRSRVSQSVVLHARRIIGIARVANNLDFWDPLLTAAVTQAGKIFSHSTQRRVAASVLRKSAEASGIRLVAHIDELG